MVEVFVVFSKLMACVLAAPAAFVLAERAHEWMEQRRVRSRVQSRSAAQRLDGSKPEDVQ